MEPKPDTQSAKPKSPLLALVLAFTPSVVFLAFITFIRNGVAPVSLKPILFAIAGLSLGCCIASSTMLLKRRTPLSIIGGLVLLVLNTLIVLFLGCTASISGVFQ